MAQLVELQFYSCLLLIVPLSLYNIYS